MQKQNTYIHYHNGKVYFHRKEKKLQKQYRSSVIVRNENKIGRNDPCPCGSGKKYKSILEKKNLYSYS